MIMCDDRIIGKIHVGFTLSVKIDNFCGEKKTALVYLLGDNTISYSSLFYVKEKNDKIS